LYFSDLQRDDYVIESMHDIDSSQIKYPAERDKKWARDGILKHPSVFLLSNLIDLI